MKFLLILVVLNSLGQKTHEFEYEAKSYDQCQRMGRNTSLELNLIFTKEKMTVKFDCEDVED